MDKKFVMEQDVKVIFALCTSVDYLSNSDDVSVWYLRPENLRTIGVIYDVLKRNGIDFDFHKTRYYKYLGVACENKWVIRIKQSVLKDKPEFGTILYDYYTRKNERNSQQLQTIQNKIPLLFPFFKQSSKVALLNSIVNNTR